MRIRIFFIATIAVVLALAGISSAKNTGSGTGGGGTFTPAGKSTFTPAGKAAKAPVGGTYAPSSDGTSLGVRSDERQEGRSCERRSHLGHRFHRVSVRGDRVQRRRRQRSQLRAGFALGPALPRGGGRLHRHGRRPQKRVRRQIAAAVVHRIECRSQEVKRQELGVRSWESGIIEIENPVGRRGRR